MPMTPEDVRSKEFTTVRLHLGYDMDEVDAFLDEVEEELIRRERERDDLVAKANKATAPYAGPAPMVGPAPAPAPVDVPAASGSAVKVLELAQRTADEHLANAKADAEKMVAEAEEKRRTTLAEAEEKRRSILSSLEAEKAVLQAKVDDLRNFEREYHTRLKEYIQGQLRDLDARPDDASVPKPVATLDGQPAGPQSGEQSG
jgi:DivIVA domain-containing protein